MAVDWVEIITATGTAATAVAAAVVAVMQARKATRGAKEAKHHADRYKQRGRDDD